MSRSLGANVRRFPYTARALRRRRVVRNIVTAACLLGPLVIILPLFLLGVQNVDCRIGGEVRQPELCAATYAAIEWLRPGSRK